MPRPQAGSALESATDKGGHCVHPGPERERAGPQEERVKRGWCWVLIILRAETQCRGHHQGRLEPSSSHGCPLHPRLLWAVCLIRRRCVLFFSLFLVCHRNKGAGSGELGFGTLWHRFRECDCLIPSQPGGSDWRPILLTLANTPASHTSPHGCPSSCVGPHCCPLSSHKPVSVSSCPLLGPPATGVPSPILSWPHPLFFKELRTNSNVALSLFWCLISCAPGIEPSS